MKHKLKKRFINKIKLALLEQKKGLMLKNYNEEIDFDGDETDEIQGKIIANVNSQLSNRDKQKFLQIEKALNKIDNNTYGICEECNELIAEKRLEINPYFDICIGCAEQREFEEKRRITN